MSEHALRVLEEGLEAVKAACCEALENGLICEYDRMLAGLEDVTHMHETRKADLDGVGMTLQHCHKKAEELQ